MQSRVPEIVCADEIHEWRLIDMESEGVGVIRDGIWLPSYIKYRYTQCQRDSSRDAL